MHPLRAPVYRLFLPVAGETKGVYTKNPVLRKNACPAMHHLRVLPAANLRLFPVGCSWPEAQDAGEPLTRRPMATHDTHRRGYLIIWEFRPRKGAENRFQEAYGPQGIWAKFFARGEGFIGTELNLDLKDPTRYLTLDFWESKQAYDAFREAHPAEYQAIDEQCEALTAEEKPLGTFEVIR